MTIVRTFTWGTHTDDPTIEGWIMKGMETFDPVREGVGLAHDVLEHFNPTDTSIEGEFLAFGSMLYLRGEPDWWSGVHASVTDPGWAMSSDIAHFVAKTVKRDNSVATPPRHNKLGHEVEEIVTSTYLHAMRELRYEADGTGQHWQMRAELRKALGWMRVGYRKANRRWQLPIHERVHLFDIVAALKLPRSEDDDEGLIESVKVHVDARRSKAWITTDLYTDPFA